MVGLVIKCGTDVVMFFLDDSPFVCYVHLTSTNLPSHICPSSVSLRVFIKLR